MENNTEEKATVKSGAGRTLAKDAAYIAVCVALTAVCAWITVPMPEPFVQFTLQTFAVFFTVLLLGEGKSSLAILAYVLLGLIGVPVFSKFQATAAIVGTTGGYIVGFFFIPLSSFLFRKLFKGNIFAVMAGLFVGLFICYAFGTAWFMILYSRKVGAIGLGSALMWCVVPYILPDGLKLAAAVLIAPKLKKILKIG